MENIKYGSWEVIPHLVQDWVILDIDQVIIDTADPIFTSQLFEQHRKRWHEQKSYAENMSRIIKRYKLKLIDMRIPSWINQWQKDKKTVIALTAFPTGTWGVIPSMEDLRINQLKNFGIFFSHFYKNQIFEGFESPYPVYKEGMLLTARYSKGIILSHFFINNDIKPKHVLFVDDKQGNVRDVGNFCKQLNIAFDGVILSRKISDVTNR